jgi:hypothetical protein
MAIAALLFAVAVWFGFGIIIGILLGRRIERRAQEAVSERLRRIDPGSRTPGLPTNNDSEPATVRKARIWR